MHSIRWGIYIYILYSMAWDSRMWSGTYWQFRGMRGIRNDGGYEFWRVPIRSIQMFCNLPSFASVARFLISGVALKMFGSWICIDGIGSANGIVKACNQRAHSGYVMYGGALWQQCLCHNFWYKEFPYKCALYISVIYIYESPWQFPL